MAIYLYHLVLIYYLIVEYLKEYRLNNPTVSKEELDKMRKELYPNGSKTEFEKEFKE